MFWFGVVAACFTCCRLFVTFGVFVCVLFCCGFVDDCLVFDCELFVFIFGCFCWVVVWLV